ncbi:MAG: hypothetical protein WBB01_25770 [Phormidesmis sp.]
MSPSVTARMIDFSLSEAAPGSLGVQWIHGSVSAKHNQDPDGYQLKARKAELSFR